MTVREAAEAMQMPVEKLRAGIVQGFLPVGVGYKHTPKSKRYTFIIYPQKVREWVLENYGREI